MNLNLELFYSKCAFVILSIEIKGLKILPMLILKYMEVIISEIFQRQKCLELFQYFLEI